MQDIITSSHAIDQDTLSRLLIHTLTSPPSQSLLTPPSLLWFLSVFFGPHVGGGFIERRTHQEESRPEEIPTALPSASYRLAAAGVLPCVGGER